jgi:lipopolysaccharide biosynthesis glycosyltransferase
LEAGLCKANVLFCIRRFLQAKSALGIGDTGVGLDGVKIKNKPRWDVEKVKKEPLHFAFCMDAGYAPYTGVALTSIVLNNIGEQMVFHLLYSHMHEADIEKFKQTAALYRNVTIAFYHLGDIKQTEKYKTGYHFTKEMFYRLYIPFVLPQDIKKVFYLDGDVLCTGSLAELFSMSFDGHPVIADGSEAPAETIERLHISSGQSLHSGQLVMDLPAWRKCKITERTFELLDARGQDFEWPDNDALICSLDGDFQKMPLIYAKMIDCATEMRDITADVRLIHYLGSTKPWKSWCFSESRHLWWEYAQRSLWHDLKPEEPQNVGVVLWLAQQMAVRGRVNEALRYYEAFAHFVTDKGKNKE